jgi:hypothetical protein
MTGPPHPRTQLTPTGNGLRGRPRCMLIRRQAYPHVAGPPYRPAAYHPPEHPQPIVPADRRQPPPRYATSLAATVQADKTKITDRLSQVPARRRCVSNSSHDAPAR